VFAQVQLMICAAVYVPVVKHVIVKHSVASHHYQHAVTPQQLADDEEERSKWVVVVAEATTKTLKVMKASLLHGSLRSFLTTLCFLALSLELFEDLLEVVPIPFLFHAKGRVKVGVVVDVEGRGPDLPSSSAPHPLPHLCTALHCTALRYGVV
jgi:hypothetical protein